MILFRFAWIIALVAIAGHALTSCASASGKPFPEDSFGLMRSSLPAWLTHPGVAMDLIWIRGARGRSEVRNGTCVIRMPDGGEGDLDPAEDLVRACERIGGLQLHRPIPAGAIRLNWHPMASVADVGRLYDLLFADGGFAPLGFYYQPDPRGPCHVVTALDQAALGHEIKHCFDGFFHYTGGRWKPRTN